MVKMDTNTPPIERLSRASDADNGRYSLGGPSVPKALRLFLVLSTSCVHTKTSIKLVFASEGLPSDVDSLGKQYYRFHSVYEMTLCIQVYRVIRDTSTSSENFANSRKIVLQ